MFRSGCLSVLQHKKENTKEMEETSRHNKKMPDGMEILFAKPEENQS